MCGYDEARQGRARRGSIGQDGAGGQDRRWQGRTGKIRTQEGKARSGREGEQGRLGHRRTR